MIQEFPCQRPLCQKLPPHLNGYEVWRAKREVPVTRDEHDLRTRNLGETLGVAVGDVVVAA